ncbi:zinc transporter slc39a7 histidine-rich membrane protein ke4 [Holotrichia oblita]|uniref:Zinc transporter slc39a7 histidine-rich membrane protein ke4 n=1 Tax=Holotrichia oblita TaxID=644536 RepID=A0ACB9T5B2_HOLOL|nr:zinc transporter slc39a7 histidine-rich membrane protein ke4 [Holotrichia oblita]
MSAISANLYNCGSGTENTTFSCLYQEIVFDLLPAWIMGTDGLPWVGVMIGSILVGLSGILPLVVIPLGETDDLKQGDKANFLKSLLSFAVGGLLGDVFLHSLPEIWAHDVNRNGGQPSMYTGLLILTGLIVFVITEKIFSVITKYNEEAVDEATNMLQNPEKINNNIKGYEPDMQAETERKKHITGYLNLVANAIDNFTHGLSLGGAFLVSFRLGCLTTFAILMHEVPHEVGDFAILLKSGFTRCDAALFQLFTAGVGLMGSLASLVFSGASNSMEARASWILPFTAGTFLHIGLVTILPDLLKEEDPKESLKQITALLLGIFIMACVTNVLE